MVTPPGSTAPRNARLPCDGPAQVTSAALRAVVTVILMADGALRERYHSNGAQGKCGHRKHQVLQGTPKPTKRNRTGNDGKQYALFIEIHSSKVAPECKKTCNQSHKGKGPIAHIALSKIPEV
jgi:hypothetical protein